MSNNTYKQDIKSFARIKDIEYNSSLMSGEFDLKHLQKIHAYIFQDSPELSPGKFRNDTENWFKRRHLEAEKNQYAVPYLRGKLVSANLEKILKVKIKELQKLKIEEFCKFFSDFYAQLDFTHPFLEGNSRTLRTFTKLFAKEVGYFINWNTSNVNPVTRDTLYKARDIEVMKLYYSENLNDNYLANHNFKNINEYELAFSAYKGYISIVNSKKLLDLVREEIIKKSLNPEAIVESSHRIERF